MALPPPLASFASPDARNACPILAVLFGDKIRKQPPVLAALPLSRKVTPTKTALIPAGTPANTVLKSISVLAVVERASPSQSVDVSGVVRYTQGWIIPKIHGFKASFNLSRDGKFISLSLLVHKSRAASASRYQYKRHTQPLPQKTYPYPPMQK